MARTFSAPLLFDASGNLLTALQSEHSEDSAHSSGDKGVLFLGVRSDAGGSLVGTDGDYTPLSFDSTGKLRVVSSGATGGTSAVDDAAFTAGTDSGTPAMGFFSTDVVDSGDVGVLAMDASRRLLVSIDVDNVGIGGGTQYTEDAAAATDPIGTAQILVRQDTPATLVTTDGDNVARRGTNYGAAYTQILSSTGSFIDTFGGGTEYTEDVVSPADPVGGTLMMTRDDALSTVTEAAGDWSRVRGDAFGALWVSLGTQLSHTQDSIGIGDGTDTVLVTGSGEMNVIATAQPGIDIGDVTINNASIAITAASLPLPTGAATAAKQLADGHNVTVDNATGGSAVNIQDGGNSITVDGTVTAGHDITGIANGRKTVTLAGTAVALAASTTCKKIDIVAETNNTGTIVVGGSGAIAALATRQGVPLNAGEAYSIEIDNLADVFIDATVSTEGVTFAYFT